MLFVTLCKVKAATTRERTARRLEYKYPEGLKVIAEYWLQSEDPSVIVITESDSAAVGFAALSAWDDVFSMTVIPAITAEEGLQMARQMR